MREKLYFIGTLPEPTGGVTIYNERKVGLLMKDYDVHVIQPKYNTIFDIICILFFKEGKVYISTFNFLMVFLVVLFGFKNFHFVDHNSSRHVKNFDLLKRKICIQFFKNAKEIILVSSHLAENYKDFGFYGDVKFKVEEAFIPPNISKKRQIIENFYPKILKDNLINRNLIIASASKTNLDIFGKDIYSLELTLNAYDKLSTKYPNLIFIMAIAEFSKDDFGDKIKKISEELKEKHKNFLLLTNNTPIWPLFDYGLIFLRITTTDGDSVSLKEALFFDCPVLATDVVSRPNGTKLFNLLDDDLFDEVCKIIEEIR